MFRKIIIVITALVLLTGVVFFTQKTDTAYAVRCFLTGQQVSGMYKICYYDCLGSTAAITVGSYQLCPVTINR